MAFIKSPEDEDLSKYFESVKFHLHHSFENPMVLISKYPYALQLSGWGEFTIKMEINLKKPYQATTIFLSHYLKFHPKDTSKKIFLTKQYDEIFLQNVPEGFGQGNTANEFLINQDLRFVQLAKETGDPYRELLAQIDSIKEADFKGTTEKLRAALEFVQDEIDNTAKEIGNVERSLKAILNQNSEFGQPVFSNK